MRNANVEREDYVEVYIWEDRKIPINKDIYKLFARLKRPFTHKGHVSLQLFENGVAACEDYVSFFPKSEEILERSENILCTTKNGLFLTPVGDNNQYESKEVEGIHDRKKCETKVIKGLNIPKMQKKIKELRSSPLLFKGTSSSLLSFEHSHNCTSIVSEILHAGGVKRYFKQDQIVRTTVSLTMAYAVLSAFMYYTDYAIYTKRKDPLYDLLTDTMSIMCNVVVPAKITAYIISWLKSLNEGEYFLLSTGLSSIMVEIMQRRNSSNPWSFSTLPISIIVTTAIIKFIPKLISLSSTPVSTSFSFALGAIFGRYVDRHIEDNMYGGWRFTFDLFLMLMLSISAISGQLLPDVLAFLIRLPLSKMKQTSMLHSFCDRLTRFAWLFESPKSLEKLLEIIESKDLLPDGATERDIEDNNAPVPS